MTIRNIVLIGNPILRQPTSDVTFPLSKENRALLHDLLDTLHEFRRQCSFGRGISAPQIGESKKVICIDMDGDTQFFINAKIVKYGEDTFEMFDDCFSIPEIMVKLVRSKCIILEYDDEHGAHHKKRFHGAMSELLQHEVDHLYGTLAIDRAISSHFIWSRTEWLNQQDKP